MYDITIIGAGLAGLQVARLAARAGASVLLVDARRSVTEFVRTTGIFVRKTFDEFSCLEPFLGSPVRRVAIHSPEGQSIEMASDKDEFRVGRMKPLYQSFLQQAIAGGARWLPETTYAGLHQHSGFSEVFFRNGSSVVTRYVVGADGARSRVAAHLGLDQNRRWISGIENVYPSRSPSTPKFDCWIDPRIAPGYLAWMLDDGEEMHVGLAGHLARFDPVSALQHFEARLKNEGRLTAAAPIERRGGLIPVNGVLRRIGNERGLLVGDAAGAVSPLTAGGLDACMRLSAHAASVLLTALNDGTALVRYDGSRFRNRFASRIAMRRLFDVATRSVPVIELGFTVGRAALANSFVRHVFFGRGSFPEIAEERPRERAECK